MLRIFLLIALSSLFIGCTEQEESFFKSNTENNNTENNTTIVSEPDINETLVLNGKLKNEEVLLQWDANSDITDLQIYMGTDSDINASTQLVTVNVSDLSYTVTSLDNAKTYWFWAKYRTINDVWHNSNAFSITLEAPLLNQDGNPLTNELTTYSNWLSGNLTTDKEYADNMITWQLPHGGFYKNKFSIYQNAWDGNEKRSGWFGENNIELGTIDNEATVAELLFMADVYKRSQQTKYRDAVRKAMDFILTMQHDKGGFAQVYPARVGTTYSNFITFNDQAMVRALLLLEKARKNESPLDGDVLSTEQRIKAEDAITRAVQYILKAQIVQNGTKTVWCAQHDPDTYEPRGARSYELVSKSGKESVGIIAFLMMQPQTQEIKESIQSALVWFQSSDVKAENTKYVKRATSSSDDTYNPIQTKTGETMWYRFYDVDSDTPFFSGRLPTDKSPGVGKQYDLMDVEPERRYGYEWGGNYGKQLLKYAGGIGY